MERKSFPFELEEKGLDPEARTFQGYAAVMGNVDEGRDVIVKGAFKKTIQEMGNRVKVFYIHDFMQPIGKVLELNEVPKGKLPQRILDRAPDATGGLYVKGYISPTTIGDTALTLMKDTVLDELSIGYDTIKHEMKEVEEDEDPVRLLREIKLYDISPVPLAMNPAAMITSVKKWLDTFADEHKVEVTENYVRIPVAGESGKHDGHRIRTITISKDQGIKALYCGECKKVITYLFDKEKWTVARAKEWVKEHSKAADDAHEQLAAVEAAAVKVVDEYLATGVVSHDTCDEFTATVTELLLDWEKASANIDTSEQIDKAQLSASIQRAEIQRQQIEEL
jgi:HK97 family phage prohead protease